jgi:hypothetical protein
MLVHGTRRYWFIAITCFSTILLIWPSAKLYRQRVGTPDYEVPVFENLPVEKPSVEDDYHATPEQHIPQQNASQPDAKGDKIIVMAKVETEDTSWVAENLPE